MMKLGGGAPYTNLAWVRIWGPEVKGQGHRGQKKCKKRNCWVIPLSMHGKATRAL